MFIEKYNKFGFRKLNNGHLASVVIGSVGLMLAVGGHVEAKVVNNGDGTTTISNAKSSITLESDKVRLDGRNFTEKTTVLNGHDIVTEKGKVKYKYETIDGELLEESDAKDSGVTKTLDATYDVIGRSGKLYKHLNVEQSGELDIEAGNKAVIEKDGKKYHRVGDAVLSGDGGEVSETTLNDVSARLNSEGLITDTGAINHSNVKAGGHTWILQETPTGISKYVRVETPATTSDNWLIDTFQAGEATAKEFNNTNVTADGGIQEGDYVFIIEKNVYATIGENIETHTGTMTLSLKDVYDIQDHIDNEPDAANGEALSKRLYKLTKDVLNGTREGGEYTRHFVDAYKQFLRMRKTEDSYGNFVDFLGSTAVANGMTDSPTILSREAEKMFSKLGLDESDSDGKPTSSFWVDHYDNHSNLWDETGFDLQKGDYHYSHSEFTDEENEIMDQLGIAPDARDPEKFAKLPALLARHSDIAVNGTVNPTVTFYEETYKYHTNYIPLRAYKLEHGESVVTYKYAEEKERVIDKKGSVVVHFESTDGATLKELVALKTDAVVKTITSKYYVDESGREVIVPDSEVTTDTPVEYNSSTLPPANIDSDNGERYYLTTNKLKANSAAEQGLVVADTTLNVTYLYEKAGDVVVHYQTTDGVTIKDDVVESDKAKPGTPYDTTDNDGRPEIIETNGKKYKRVAKITGDETGNVVSGQKLEITYFYEEVKKGSVVANYYIQNTDTKLADSVEQRDLDVETPYVTGAKTIEPKTEVIDEPDKTITRTTRYELVETPNNATGNIVEGDTVVNYYYREVVEDVVTKKQAPVMVNYYKDGTTDKLTPSVDKGQSDIGSNYTTEPAVIEPKVEVVDTPEKTVTTTTTYTLKEVPADKDGQVPVGGKVVNYYYVENVDVKEVKKQAPVMVNYYKDGTTDKLAPSVDKGQSDIGSNYTTEPAVIEPKVEVVDTPEKTVTTTTTYTLKEVPADKDGQVPVGGKVVNYYYVEKVDVQEVKKQAPVTVNYYKDGTTDKLAPLVDKGQSDIGSNYTTEPAVIEPKVEVVDTPDKTVTTTTTYTLKEVPADKNGQVPVGGKVVNYYYVENVDVKEVKKQAPVTVNYYKDGTTDKIAPSVDKGQSDIGSNYTTEPAVIEPKVDVVDTPEKTVTTTTTYTLKEVPADKDGQVPVGGKVVNYYYVENIFVKETPKGPNATPGTPEVHEKPEYKEPIGTPGTPEVYEKPEYKEPIGTPGTPEVHEKPEFNGGTPGITNVVQNIPEPAVKTKEGNGKKELPKTGDMSMVNMGVAFLATSLLGMRKKRDD